MSERKFIVDAICFSSFRRKRSLYSLRTNYVIIKWSSGSVEWLELTTKNTIIHILTDDAVKGITKLIKINLWTGHVVLHGDSSWKRKRSRDKRGKFFDLIIKDLDILWDFEAITDLFFIFMIMLEISGKPLHTLSPRFLPSSVYILCYTCKQDKFLRLSGKDCLYL